MPDQKYRSPFFAIGDWCSFFVIDRQVLTFFRHYSYAIKLLDLIMNIDAHENCASNWKIILSPVKALSGSLSQVTQLPKTGHPLITVSFRNLVVNERLHTCGEQELSMSPTFVHHIYILRIPLLPRITALLLPKWLEN